MAGNWLWVCFLLYSTLMRLLPFLPPVRQSCFPLTEESLPVKHSHYDASGEGVLSTPSGIPQRCQWIRTKKKQVSMSLNHPNYFSSLKFEKNAQFLFNWQINLEVCQLAIRFHCQPLPDSSFESASLAAAAVCAAARFSSAVFTAAYAEAKRGWVGQGKATCEVSAIVTIGKVLRRSISIRFRNFHRPSFLHAMIITMKHQRWTLGRRKKTWGTCRSRLQCWQLRTQGLWFRAKKNVHHFELWFIGDGWRLIVESTSG